MDSFRIAIVQSKRDPYNCRLNTEKGLKIVREAKRREADIVLFPECWITGYEFPDFDKDLPLKEIERMPEYQQWFSRSLDEGSPYICRFCELAKDLQIGVVITGFTRGRSRPQNSAFVINRNGKIILKYSKVHTCDSAGERLLESGSDFKVCDFDGVKIGIMICYDREYPESARILMLKGAELILVPNDCGAMFPRVQALSTRAYENMTGVAMANPPGENAGCSCAFSPIVWDEKGLPVDNRIVLADGMTEAVYIAEYDLRRLRNYRSHEMMGNTFRKVEAYAELLNDEIKEPFIRKI
ncbi:carbon-nitrogen hydrolase family protein [Sporolactobacillus sp. CQH2019]|uniref:carbon-nitrogen hydrolase family protein n=1 Tax=Sporolactobacillus sp. CQH2019 TaxID=3023512 RepID=UPI0023682CB3|nr:carbon-nitrogen hydrolase family protein [Sporolactobacillus sp. CQH2019]MDD9149796.1 carbon-nitrogen hydrolase family protein [Sporolactobacillus sp. CQH2019]